MRLIHSLSCRCKSVYDIRNTDSITLREFVADEFNILTFFN